MQVGIEHFNRWRVLAPLGLATIGLGTSIVGQATILKGEGVATTRWVAVGTLGLCVLNAGVALVGESVKNRVLYELGR